MNQLFVIDKLEDRQIEPMTIDLHQGIVTQVTDAYENEYEGDNVQILTPRDFIHVPDLDLPLCIGDEIYLDNQSRQRWTVRYGWYEVDGNPAICGWYLESIPAGRVRSLYLKDLDNLTFVSKERHVDEYNHHMPHKKHGERC